MIDEAGNIPSNARPLGVISNSQSFADFVGATDTDDYYGLSIASRSQFGLALTNLTADADIELLDSNLAVIDLLHNTFHGRLVGFDSRCSMNTHELRSQ
ncbi:MAG: hypothetical protein AAGF93_01380 [Cyanobacteria bacterium P01_H01_bin.105]